MARKIANKMLFHKGGAVIAHATGVEYEENRPTVDVTARTDGDYAEKLADQTINVSGSVEAFLDFSPSAGENYKELRAAMENGTPLDFTISDNTVGQYEVSGKFFVNSLSGFGGSGEGASFTMSWEGTGTISLDEIT